MRGHAIGVLDRCIRGRYTQSGRNRNVVARRRFEQIRVIEALATSKPFIGIILEKIADAVHQRYGNSFVKKSVYILRRDLSTIDHS